jgi:SAM-dependent methyltransferase
MKEKIKYFLGSLGKRVVGRQNICPNCKSDLRKASTVDTKYWVTALVECPNCLLLVRTPTDDASESESFYQSNYSQGYTTDCPPDEELARLQATKFVGTERDYSRCIRFFEFLGIPKDARILDFGCSWGYGLYQMIESGYKNAEGFEVSLPRARYGIEKMSLPIRSNPAELVQSYDVIFSSHVLEHLPDFSLINELKGKLRNGGYFIAVTPNGTIDFKEADFNAFHQIWGKVHPVLLTRSFVEKNYGKELCYLDSWESANPTFARNMMADRLPRFELVFALRAGG